MDYERINLFLDKYGFGDNAPEEIDGNKVGVMLRGKVAILDGNVFNKALAELDEIAPGLRMMPYKPSATDEIKPITLVEGVVKNTVAVQNRRLTNSDFDAALNKFLFFWNQRVMGLSDDQINARWESYNCPKEG